MRGSLDDALTVGQAAELLDVSTAHVQHLGRTGQVTYVARGLLDGASVRRYRIERQGSTTRAWSGGTAWAAVGLLSGQPVPWLGQPQGSRLRSRLASLDASGLVAATRNRARARRLTAHESVIARLLDDADVVPLRSVDELSAQLVGSPFEAYATAAWVDGAARRLGLQAAVRGDLVLHEIAADRHTATVSIRWVRDLMQAPVLPALHAAAAEDPRARGLGLRVLTGVLEDFSDD